MTQQCSKCNHYEALPDEPAAGWCHFLDRNSLPFWLERNKQIASRGSDVMANDGGECDAFSVENA